MEKSGQLNLTNGHIPSNMGGNYVVYVDNINNPTKILGYRNGSTWYTAEGTEASTPSQANGIESPIRNTAISS